MHEAISRAVSDVERIHSTWIQCERARDIPGVLALCSDEIEFRPPDAPPVIGRVPVSAYLMQGNTQIHQVEISDLRIRVSNELAYLTANYSTTFSSLENMTPKTTSGSHLWILKRQGATWLVSLVAWSVWKRAEDGP
jgi:ketosteroid isomerase-like protein